VSLIKHLKLPALIVCLFTVFVFAADSFTGKVVGITDGDTIKVLKDGKEVKVRLDGIDCPETGQAFGKRAKQFASDMVFGKEVKVKSKGLDKYGRTLGEVILPDGKSLNRELIRAGLAWWYRQYSQDSTLGVLESEAREERIGLWADADPIAPWDYRHGTGVLVNNSKAVPQNSESSEATIYITKTGTKYHSVGCRYLSKSKIPMKLKDATAAGYSPCSVCQPPALKPKN